MSYIDICQLILVSKKLNSLIIYIQELNIHSNQIKFIRNIHIKCNLLKRLHIYNIENIDDLLGFNNIAINLASLTLSSISITALNEHTTSNLTQYIPTNTSQIYTSIISLTIYDVFTSCWPFLVAYITTNTPNIQHLKIMKSASIQPEHIYTILNKCTNLISLHLEMLYSLKVLYFFPPTIPSLTALSSSYTTTPILVPVSINIMNNATRKHIWHNLKQLTIKKCPNFKEFMYTSPTTFNNTVTTTSLLSLDQYKLECLDLSYTPISTLNLLSWLPLLRLTKLSLDSCRSLTGTLPVYSTTLVYISLTGCDQLAGLDIKCPYLHALYIQQCYSLTDLTVSSHVLVDLDLSLLNNLKAVTLHCPSMTSRRSDDCEDDF